jgi:gamma-glutamyltranspeptidase/glutathione hydrolase
MLNKKFRVVVITLLLISALSASLVLAQATAVGREGMVAGVDEYATQVGVEVLKKGGNAVDAAVAVSLALAVTHPQAGNLGGGGFFVLHLHEKGINTTIDYRERAPLAAHRDMYLDEQSEVIEDASTLGYRACGVPGQVGGLWLAHQKYGKLPWKELVEPAIKLAEEGIVVNYWLAGSLQYETELFNKYPATAAIFTKDGKPYAYGDLLMQKDLAWTLRQIADKGHDGFYRGEVARRIAADMAANGGLITEADLAAYEAVERPPVNGKFHSFEIVSMGPPSSGGIILIQILGMLESYDLSAIGHNSSRYIQLLTEAEKLAYADRAEHMGDADFYPVPVEELISPAYIAERRLRINPERATPSAQVGHGEPSTAESEQTTHFSVVDRWGNAVACTTTLNDSFGAHVVAAGTGVVMNDEMDDFSAKPGVPNIYGLIGGEANAISPGKRMLSSMTPTIVLKDGRVYLVVGTPGGSTIPTTVIQVVLNVLVHRMPLQSAVAAPRFHHQWLPDRTQVESIGFSKDVVAALRGMGHEVSARGWIGDVHAVLVAEKTGLLIGVSDPRRGGVARGF